MNVVYDLQAALDQSADAGDSERLSDLISVVYDAAIDPSLWPGAIEQVTKFVEAVGAGVFCKDVDAQHVFIPYSSGVQWPLPVDLFRQIYPAAVGHFLGDADQLISTRELMPFDQLVRTGFYREWAKPRGLVDFVSALLERSATSSVIFGVFRHEEQGPADQGVRRRLRLIVPHVRRAVLITRMFDLKVTESATLAEALEGLGAGMFLVDETGRIVHANGAGTALLESGDAFRSVGGRLAAREARDDYALRAIFAAAGQGDAALGTAGTAMPLTGLNGDRYLAHVLPLTSGARRLAGITGTAVAALFVRRADGPMESRSEAIAQAFKLTPTELRVLLAIVEVGGVPEVAIALGVAETTVRTHVGRLFQKTGTSRQADLVKLVAGYRSPLR